MRVRRRPFVLFAGSFAAVVVVAACGARSELPTAIPERCGDGRLDASEDCDDGNRDDDDGCRAVCVPAACGDGVRWPEVEACDDGNLVGGDGCTATCGPDGCGDGVVQGDESCDDGNLDATDACLPSCLPAFCGDGFVRAGVEACDDANGLVGDGCIDCVQARCGDGYVWLGVEECDDGNAVDDDGCDLACRLPVCGDGKRAGDEACDAGDANEDRPAFEVSQPSLAPFGTDALVAAKSAVAFYDYASASSHTGLEAEGESRVYLYLDRTTGKLSLFLSHGRDGDQDDAELDMDVTGLPAGFAIEVADDKPQEFFATGPTSASGRWKFGNNTDGGVLGGLPFPGRWKIVVTPTQVDGVDAWNVVAASGARRGLSFAEPATIEAFDAPSDCRRDCTIPRCGDAILDGGERCDDGNTVGGDGCSGNCQELF